MQAHVRALLTQICKSRYHKTPRVISRCFIENKHPGPFNWQIEIYLGQQMFERRQLSHFVMRIVNMAQKEYKKQHSLCASFLCMCLNAGVYVCVFECVNSGQGRWSIYSNFWEEVDLECRLCMFSPYRLNRVTHCASTHTRIHIYRRVTN